MGRPEEANRVLPWVYLVPSFPELPDTYASLIFTLGEQEVKAGTGP